MVRSLGSPKVLAPEQHEVQLADLVVLAMRELLKAKRRMALMVLQQAEGRSSASNQR